ncbi:MAG: ATP-binding protein [Desulfovibrio sp.]|uniref:ATP-binding protein n=1 Tax=Desulfovibrio sp. 7SRBS1 TaxID=3378064 RepID=UPI003B3F8245
MPYSNASLESLSDVVVPDSMLERWQKIVDLLAALAKVPAALIMRVRKDVIEVFRTSDSEGNPYPLGASDHFFHKCGLYCEHVIRTNDKLLVPNALLDEDWKDNPDVALNMISYLGFPLLLPDSTPFGTICILDSKLNRYNPKIEGIMTQFRDVLEFQLAQLCQYEELKKALESFRGREELPHDGSQETVAELQHRLLELARSLDDANHHLQREIYERKLVERALRKSQQIAVAASRAKSEFLANMSHEIRTPLNGVMGMLQLLQDTELNTEQKELADYSILSTRRLTNLLSDILDLSRVEAGKLDLRMEAVNLHDVMASVEQLFRPTAREKGVEIKFQVSPGLPAGLMSDVTRLQQILCNIVGNAVKFTDTGMVHVQAYPLPFSKPNELRVLFSVADTGIGISEEKMDTIFDPFEQVSTGFQRESQGAGLGLAICKKLLRLMKGDLAVESREGEGTTFYLCLPFQLVEKEQDEVKAPSRSCRGNASILLVDDDLVSRIVAEKHIRALGFDVTLACNGKEALKAASKNSFDLILMDIQMPQMDGVSATMAIRRGDAGRRNIDVPIVALTAYAMAGERDVFFDAGVNDYMTKPLDKWELEALLQRMFA